MGKITVNDIDCRITRSKHRRTIALQVAIDGQVTVLMPRLLDVDIARRVVEKKISWVTRQRNMRRAMAQKYPPKEFTSGETFSLFGRTYRLQIVGNRAGQGSEIKTNRLLVRVHPKTKERVRTVLQEFLRAQTIAQAREACARYAPSLGVEVHKLCAANQSKRWGSCSRKGAIRINWKLAMAPLPVFNYVVAHEVCHLKYANHSLQFWRALKSIMPRYEKNRSWLKTNYGLLLSF